MYSTCLFCHGPLGGNRVVEAFPVGRRLAFDAEKGRLWAVCPSCRRWNLTPMEERWEAIEECERTFKTLPLRTQTDEIGAAKHPEGLGLIRIGKPVSVELATWRFGEAMAQRLKRSAIYSGIVAGAVGIGAAAGVVMGGLSGAVLLQSYNWVNLATGIRKALKGRVAISLPAGEAVRVFAGKIDLLNPDGDHQFGLRLRRRSGDIHLYDRDAIRAASKVLPHLNFQGARKGTVGEAVALVSETGGAEAFLQETWGKARSHPGAGFRWVLTLDRKGGLLGSFPGHTRLALEMSIQEEQERVALAGEVAELKAAWREAEAIAAISDELLVPVSIQERLEEMKEGEAPPPPHSSRSTVAGSTLVIRSAGTTMAKEQTPRSVPPTER